MRCARCGTENAQTAAACSRCGARLGAYAPPAPTIPDESAAAPAVSSSAVGWVLARSRGLPSVVRMTVDLLRVAVAIAVTGVVWAVAAPKLAPALVSWGVPSQAAPWALRGAALALAVVLALLVFRITSGRFVRPLRSRFH